MAREVDKRPEPSSDDQELRELEDVLGNLADTGALDECPEDAPPLPSSAAERLLQKIRAQDDLRGRLRAAHAKVNRTGCSFEALIRDVREQAGVSLEDAARAARIKRAELLRIEDGSADLLQLAPETIVSLMEVFFIRLPLFEESLKRSLAARRARAGLSTPVARATNAEARDLERAMQDMAEFFAEESSTPSAVVFPAEYIGRIKTALERWGRTDLL
jgi:hypothetical protein